MPVPRRRKRPRNTTNSRHRGRGAWIQRPIRKWVDQTPTLIRPIRNRRYSISRLLVMKMNWSNAADASMTPLEAIEACTARAPNALGLKMAPKSGQVKQGYDADVLALKGNPLTDIEFLAEAENVSHVRKVGKLHKAPDMEILEEPH